jgi:hypothetical protein
LVGIAGGAQTGINVPLQNSSLMNVQGGTWQFGLNDANNNSLSMNDGSINLSGGADVEMLQNYTQTGGVFRADASNSPPFFAVP